MKLNVLWSIPEYKATGGEIIEVSDVKKALRFIEIGCAELFHEEINQSNLASVELQIEKPEENKKSKGKSK